MERGRGRLTFAQQGNMNADEICAGKRFVEGDVLDPGSLARDAARVAQVVHGLYGLHVFVILVGGVVAQDVHVEASAFLDHGEANASGADDGDGLAGNLIAEEWQIGMPESPFVFSGEVLGAPESAGSGSFS